MPHRYGTRGGLVTGGPLDPGTLSNLDLRLTGTTLSGNPDDQIQTWNDSSGNGRHATQPTVGNRPYISGANGFNPNSPSGKIGLGFNVLAPSYMSCNLPLTPIDSSKSYTCYYWGYQYTTAANQVIWETGTNNPRLFEADASSLIGYQDQSAVKTFTATPTGYHSMVWIFNPPNTTGSCSVYLDGILQGSNTRSLLTDPTAAYTLGISSALTKPYAGNIFEFDFFSAAHSEATMRRILAWGRSQWGF